MLPALTDYSVVIATLGGRDSLQRCLAALAAQTRPPLEVILVVPGGAVSDPSFLDGGRDVRVLDGPRSMTGQRNVGARAARGDVVLFLDDDIMLEPDYGAELMSVWERRGLDRIAGVVGVCVNEDFFAYGSGSVKRALRAFAGLGHKAFRAKGSRRMASGHVAVVSRPEDEQDVEFAQGAFSSYRKDLLIVEPFDETFDGYVFGEDLDMSARMSSRAPIVHTPRARCFHENVSAGLRELGTADEAFRRGRMFAYFRGRHRRPGAVGRLAWEWANATEAATLGVRAVRRRDPEPFRVFVRALGETRRQLRDEEGTRPPGLTGSERS